MVGVTVRRERRWTSAGETAARRLVLDPMPMEAPAESTKLWSLVNSDLGGNPATNVQT